MSEIWADVALFTLPFRALVARCFGADKARYYHSHREKVSCLWLAFQVAFLSEEIATWAAQADTHLKPSQFNEAQHVGSNKSCLSLFPLTEPFQGLVQWDYSAGGAGDGAGKNLFAKSPGSVLAVSSLRFSALGMNLPCVTIKYRV